jgi:hypothetical protein
VQIGFIDFICAPVYEALRLQFPSLTPLADGTKENRVAWEALQKEEYVMRHAESSSSQVTTKATEPPVQTSTRQNNSKTCCLM